MMNNHEQIEEYEISYNFIFEEEEDNNKLKKERCKRKRQFWVGDTFLHSVN